MIQPLLQSVLPWTPIFIALQLWVFAFKALHLLYLFLDACPTSFSLKIHLPRRPSLVPLSSVPSSHPLPIPGIKSGCRVVGTQRVLNKYLLI